MQIINPILPAALLVPDAGGAPAAAVAAAPLAIALPLAEATKAASKRGCLTIGADASCAGPT